MVTSSILEKAARIRLLAFDVDGVLTDGRLILGPQGEDYLAFHTRDGQGLVMLKDAGFQLAIITGRGSESVATRMRTLGIKYVYQHCKDKLTVFEALLSELDLKAEQAAYMGDDLPDLPVLRRVGLAATVADAHPLIAQYCHYQSSLAGGRGAARELCDLILEATGADATQLPRYGVDLP